jgi:hypothetical protein
VNEERVMGLATMDNMDTVVGSFVEKDFGKTHEYSLIGDDMFGLLWMGEEYPHKLWTLDGFRYANIKKTVAYIIVDEDEYGLPVVQKWDIKQHKEF